MPEIDETKLIRLYYNNNWENHQFYVKVKDKTSGKLEEVYLKKISTVFINGETYKVKTVVDNRSYPDHGHTYYATSNDYLVPLEVLGVEMPLPLSKLITHPGIKVFVRKSVRE